MVVFCHATRAVGLSNYFGKGALKQSFLCNEAMLKLAVNLLFKVSFKETGNRVYLSLNSVDSGESDVMLDDGSASRNLRKDVLAFTNQLIQKNLLLDMQLRIYVGLRIIHVGLAISVTGSRGCSFSGSSCK